VRRSAFVLLAVVAIAIAVSAAYILRRNPPSPSPAVALVEQPSEPALAADLELSLSVNRGLAMPIRRGWPVLLDVLITNPSADASVTLRSLARGLARFESTRPVRAAMPNAGRSSSLPNRPLRP
jgi:hypothetical protein